MTRVEIVAIVIRIGAVWLFMVGIAGLTFSVVSTVGAHSVWDSVIPLLHLGFSIVTWSFATVLARRLLPEADSGEAVVRWTRDDVETLVLRLLGVNLLAWGVAGLVYSVVLEQLQSGQEWSTIERASHLAELARNAALCAVGTLLVLGKARLKRAWDRFRGTGMGDADPSEPGG